MHACSNTYHISLPSTLSVDTESTCTYGFYSDFLLLGTVTTACDNQVVRQSTSKKSGDLVIYSMHPHIVAYCGKATVMYII